MFYKERRLTQPCIGAGVWISAIYLLFLASQKCKDMILIYCCLTFSSLYSLHHSYLDLSKPCRRCPVSHMGDLSWLTFPAIGSSPHLPVIPVGNGIARIPELRSNARIGRIFHHLPKFSALNFPSDLGPELEVDPLVIN
jgi:hypothetical protein